MNLAPSNDWGTEEGEGEFCVLVTGSKGYVKPATADAARLVS
jgi:hypothetical protein